MDKKEYRDIEELVYASEEPEEVVLAELEEPAEVPAEQTPAEETAGQADPEEPESAEETAEPDSESAEAEDEEDETAGEAGSTDIFGYEDDLEDPSGCPACPGCSAPLLMSTPGESRTVVGVRFRTAGKTYYFSPGDLPIRKGTPVIVETSRGIEYGTASADPMEVDSRRYNAPLRQVIRIATQEDQEKVKNARAKEKEARRICQEKIRSRGLDMKLIDAEYTFDGSKILFYFTADGRVDFRDLVKDLAGVFRTRIELRQIGVRDETKILGGYGSCGRPLCCHCYLTDFVPVSIKMAKEQNLSLNPTKISGVCGRLMCCLKNEEDTYEVLNKNLPRVGDEVEGSDGLCGEVQSVNVLRQTVRILVDVDDEKEIHEYSADQLTILRRRRRGSARKKAGKENAGEASSRQQEQRPSEKKEGRKQKEDRQNRQDKPEKQEKQPREERPEKQERQPKPDRPDKQDKQNPGSGENKGSKKRHRRPRRDRAQQNGPESGAPAGQ